MHPSRSRRPARPRPRRARLARLAGVGLGLVVLLTACGDDDVAPAPPAAQATDATPTAGGLVVVLPPADGLADAERARMRLLVARALEAVLPAVDAATTPVLEPSDAGSVVVTVERAVRRAGAGGTVCILGADLADLVAPLFALYPATRPCLLPDPGEGRGDLVADVDLEGLGRELGAAARAAAGAGTVLVLLGPDAMLDDRWGAGVIAGALGAGGTVGAVRGVRTAEEALTLLDEQAALLEEGIVPGSPEALEREDTALDLDLPVREDLPFARALAPVEVVVLDASREAALLVAPLAERRIRVVAPRSLLLIEGSSVDVSEPGETVVLRWRVRWDVPLVGLLRRMTLGEDAGVPPAGGGDAVRVLEPGPAHLGP